VARSSKLQLDRIRRLIVPEAIRSRDLIDEHLEIVDRLETRDVETGVALIEKHCRHVLELAPRVQAARPVLSFAASHVPSDASELHHSRGRRPGPHYDADEASDELPRTQERWSTRARADSSTLPLVRGR
jgi:hypothetical protein